MDGCVIIGEEKISNGHLCWITQIWTVHHVLENLRQIDDDDKEEVGDDEDRPA